MQTNLAEKLERAPSYAEHPAGAPIPAIGAAHEGGYVGAIIPWTWADGAQAIVIVAPAADGDFADLEWDPDYTAAPGATSFLDGLANSIAIDDDQHPAAQKCRAYAGGGFHDWHLPAHGVQLALQANCCPLWTQIEAFKEGGPAAYQKDDYWSSTESQFHSGGAWLQYFGTGYSDYWSKDFELRARPVRIIIIR